MNNTTMHRGFIFQKGDPIYYLDRLTNTEYIGFFKQLVSFGFGDTMVEIITQDGNIKRVSCVKPVSPNQRRS